MVTYILYVFFYLLFYILQCGNASRLSRFRNHQEYDSNADIEFLHNLDDKTYEDLMNELPILRQVFIGNKMKKSLRLNATALPYFHQESNQKQSVPTKALASTTSSNYDNSSLRGKMTYRTLWPAKKRIKRPTRFIGEKISSVEWFSGVTQYWWITYAPVIGCYWCGHNETLLPSSTLCHDMFDSDNGQARTMARFFRAKCHLYPYYSPYFRQMQGHRYYPYYMLHEYDNGLKTYMFGDYIKGCFKRFVDVGPLYTSRGCRRHYGTFNSYARNFASHRLKKLELIAKGHSDICVHSPLAALTPFSRSISLFVRYHVCVCSTNYCNTGCENCVTSLLLLFPLLIIK
ncbi:unnamed protein product [Parnassius mnemosyne]|uniref:Uncharacterized protein n=1 Tax=Parnassius mnemosyne TaxID=213953 RepID=A0AAV1KPA9_9NEOP